MSLTCPRCGNPSRDGGLCDADESVLAGTLRAIPDLLDELVVQASKQSVTTLVSGREKERPLPVNFAAADLRSGLETLLVSWARACGGDDDPDLRGGGREAAAWLARRIYSVRLHEAAGDLVDELVQHCRQCVRCIDRHGVADIYLGDCQAEREDQPCGTPLRVRPEAVAVACWRCETVYDVQELTDAKAQRVSDANATAREIASAEWRTPDGRLINVRMIEGYARRGSILARGSRNGARLFNIGEVKKVAFEARFPKARVNIDISRRSA